MGFWFILATIALAGWFVDRVNVNRLKEVAKTQAYEDLSYYRATLENEITSNLQMVRGLAIALAEKTSLQQYQFEQIVAPLYEHSRILRNIGAAPDMVISRMYPLAGNEQAIGLNLLTHPTQAKAAIAARDSGNVVISGPLKLVQGGDALIARIPVFHQETKQFWGLLSVVIDMNKLYQAVDLPTLEEQFQVRMQSLTGEDSQNTVFYGEQKALPQDALVMNITLPNNQVWAFSAYPKQGWQADSAAIWPFRLTLITFLGLFIAAFLFLERIIKQIQDNEQHLSTMSHLAEVGAWSVNLRTREVYWSDVTKTIFDTPDQFVPGWMSTIEFFVQGKHRKRAQELMDKAIKQGQSFEEELLIATQSGQLKWISVKGYPRFEQGRCIEVQGSVQNIDERKKMELEHDKIAKHNEYLARLTTHDAFLDTQLELAHPLFTDAICEGVNCERASIWLFSDDRQQLAPSSFSHTLNKTMVQFPPWRSSLVPELFAAIETQKPLQITSARQHELTKALQDHYLVPFEINALLICPIHHRGKVMGALCAEFSESRPAWTLNDKRFLQALAVLLGSLHTNKEQQKARQLALMEKELAEQSAKVKSDFLASMSHEIRTPMNGILGMLTVLQHTELNNKQRHHIQLAQSSADALLTIINDILDFSKIEAGKLTIESVEVDLVSLLSDTLSAFALKAEAMQTKLEIDCRNMQVQFAKTDPHRLRQVLNNLLSNAIKFTEQGRINLTCYTEQTKEGMRLWCSVEDTGIGIAKEKLATIFDSFTQADSSTTRKYGGTGLGLTIASQLCELMGGTLSAYSKPNIGSTFTFFVELQSPKAIAAMATSCSELLLFIPADLAGSALRHLLAPWHMPTQVFTSATSGLQYLRDNPDRTMRLIVDPLIFSNDSDASNELQQLISKRQLLWAQIATMSQPSVSLWSSPKPDMECCYPLTPATALMLCQVEVKSHTKPSIRKLRGKILLVEDNKVNQIVAQNLLGKLGLMVHTAQHGKEALTMLNEAHGEFDLILMDCQMPEMDGYEATRLIRAEHAGSKAAKLAIIALTANAMQGDREACLAAGMDDYLSKPLQFEQLASTLEKWLARAITTQNSA
ncbi:ATP-binding protein [Pseudoalteromonas fenneropenaei]|uniref:histidine kinase n=1 Tax=Pseudoalteromonas fenneropenaei TaxID=1737459 RepID=A0ABV7CPR4_9GAMM